MTEYLFVLTRDPSIHPSAGYVVRTALGQCRRGHRVAIYLQRSAVEGACGDGAGLLESLCQAGVRLLCDAETFTLLGARPNIALETAGEPELAGMLRSPGIHAVWC